jgi:ferrous iron transport protein B
MDLIDTVFGTLAANLGSALPEGILSDLLTGGIISGVGATVIFLPQICLLFFLISLLEDTGYLARAAFVMDRVLRPFGLSGHAFVPLLSSHACALPGIMSARAVPDRRDRLATILVAPFMTCSARIPVYVLLTTILFRDRPAMAALAFTGCYALGIGAGLLSSMVARRTILRGKSRPMAMELPSYKVPSIRTALLTTLDRGLVFLKKAGTHILAISIVLWWLSSYPVATPPPEATTLRAEAERLVAAQDAPGDQSEVEAEALLARAQQLEGNHAVAMSFAGRMGRGIEPLFRPLGFDWQLSVGVVTSFAAREVFVSTMSIMLTGSEEAEDEGVLEKIAGATRSDGVTPIFTPAVCWSLLVYYVLAMQCIPTLAVTAKEAGSIKWAILQLCWMCGVAYVAALVVYQTLLALGFT